MRQQRHQEDISFHDSRSSFGTNNQDEYYQKDDNSYRRDQSDPFNRGSAESFSRPKRIVEEIRDDHQVGLLLPNDLLLFLIALITWK